MATDDRAGNGKTFAEMMNEASSVPAINPDASATPEQLIATGDELLAILENLPVSLWGKQCIVASTLFRLFTGEPDTDRRLSMLTQQMSMFADRAKSLAAITLSNVPTPDLSLPGAMAQVIPPNVPDVGHA